MDTALFLNINKCSFCHHNVGDLRQNGIPEANGQKVIVLTCFLINADIINEPDFAKARSNEYYNFLAPVPFCYLG